MTSRAFALALAACSAPAAPSLPHRTGDVHDFDFLAGAWTIHNRTRRPSDATWTEFASTSCLRIHLGGVLNVDEYHFPTRNYTAAALRTFHLASRQWSIYWIESRTGTLLPPVLGGFTGNRGEFYGIEDNLAYRFLWTRLDSNHARWEQSVSPDGTSWEPNWIMEFTRTAPPGC